ncbi:MAG: ribosome maturation factor RimM [Lachnospiraceae bacterium]|nr:ribosome maturation factor RimM [Lachnospiraceae bacterium]
MEEMLRVGVISSTHGVRGEVKVFPTTDDPQRFKELKEVTLDAGREQLVLKIQNVKFFKNMVILKFEGYDNINDIEKYKGKDLLIHRDQAVALEEGEYFIVDLIGLTVITDEGETLGTLTDVMKTGANDVYVVEMPSGREVLIPVIDQCILNVDLEAGEVKVHLLEGLLDL